MTRQLKLETLALTCLVGMAWVGHARAQERDPAAAQALFDQARTLMNAQRFDAACPKLEESQRLDPGIGTQFNLASCYEQQGKLASAWANFLEVVSIATATGQDARAQAATRRASLLERRLPRLEIVVPTKARAAGLQITRDDVIVGEAQWSVAVPVDPGLHAIEVTAPGRRAYSGAARAAEGAIVTFEVPVLESVEAEPVAVAPAPGRAAVTETAPPGATSPARELEPSGRSGGPSALVIGLGVAGVVALAGGGVLGFLASGKDADSKDECRPDDANLCSKRGVDLRDDAFLFATLSTVAFAAGGAAVLTAGVLWLTADTAEPTTRGVAVSLRADASSTGVALRGSF